MKSLSEIREGHKIYWKNSSTPMVVRARNDRYVIATTWLSRSDYSILDLDNGVCSTNDRTFNPYNYRCTEDIKRCLDDLENKKVSLSERHKAFIKSVIDIRKTLLTNSDPKVFMC